MRLGGVDKTKEDGKPWIIQVMRSQNHLIFQHGSKLFPVNVGDF